MCWKGRDWWRELHLLREASAFWFADGVKIVLKAMGKTPFAMGRGASSIDVIAAPEQVAACRWGYQCSVCLLAGDLLCCEVRRGATRGAA